MNRERRFLSQPRCPASGDAVATFASAFGVGVGAGGVGAGAGALAACSLGCDWVRPWTTQKSSRFDHRQQNAANSPSEPPLAVPALLAVQRPAAPLAVLAVWRPAARQPQPQLALRWLWVKTVLVPFWGRCTTHFPHGHWNADRCPPLQVLQPRMVRLKGIPRHETFTVSTEHCSEPSIWLAPKKCIPRKVSPEKRKTTVVERFGPMSPN